MQFTVSLISTLYVLPRELELDNSNHLEVSVTCPKSVKLIVLLLAFFKATKKSLDHFTFLLPGRPESSGSLRVESQSDSCHLFT